MHEYAFDIALAGAIRVRADSEEAARALLDERLDAADANLGCWPDNAPILMELSLRGVPSLYQVDDEDVNGG